MGGEKQWEERRMGGENDGRSEGWKERRMGGAMGGEKPRESLEKPHRREAILATESQEELLDWTPRFQKHSP
jgi:hypothetical protein